MNKSYSHSSRWQWAWMSVPLLVVLLILALTARAQQGSQGNTYIFGGAQMTFFGTHNFLTGGQGALPGIIGTVRSSPSGVLNFAPTATTHTGANDANHVDGYVRKLGTGPFLFPTGDNGHYGPFAAAADGTTGAYFFVDPTSAVTSNLAGGNYAVLPTGGPFPSATKAASLSAVSTREYWDIDGVNATAITLSWSSSSAIGTLTGGDLSKLTVAGWDGTQWVAIPSVVDGTSVLGGSSSLTAGSITTTDSFAPDTYTAYSFGSLVVAPDLTPVIYARPSTISGTKAISVVVDVFELSGVATSGTITLKLSKDPMFSLSLTPTATTVGGRPVSNAAWSLSGPSGGFYTLTTSQVIPAGGKLAFGLEGTLTPGATSGTLTVSTGIVAGSGSEIVFENNMDADKIDYFQQ
ncbi:hypothetical protein [Spirosoma koreense]